MLEENAREGVRAYFAIDSELEKRRWLPDSDPPLNAKAQEESRVPMVMCVLERKQEDGTTLLTMRSHHEIEPVTNPDWPAWVRLAGVAFHLGLQEAEDLRDPIARDRLAEYARNGEN